MRGLRALVGVLLLAATAIGMPAPAAAKQPPRHDTPVSNSMLDTEPKSKRGTLNLARKESKPASTAGFLSGACAGDGVVATARHTSSVAAAQTAASRRSLSARTTHMA